MTAEQRPPEQQPVFYYDLGSPECYLAAELVMSELSPVPEWEPVLGRAIPTEQPSHDRSAIEHGARALGLQPLRWPERWPPDTELAMLTATYAKRVGRAVAFSLAAFRQAFAGGRDLGEEGTVLIAAAACEMHPTAILKGVGLRSTTVALAEASRRASQAGVRALPTIAVGEELFAGPNCIAAAGAALDAGKSGNPGAPA